MDKIIPFNKGIHRQPSLGEAGELSECVNLIPVNGELVNVRGLIRQSDRTVKGELLCVHRTEDKPKYFTLEGDIVHVYDEQLQLKQSVEMPYKKRGKVTSLAIGNIVVLSGFGEEYIFMMYQRSEYKMFTLSSLRVTSRIIPMVLVDNGDSYTIKGVEGIEMDWPKYFEEKDGVLEKNQYLNNVYNFTNFTLYQKVKGGTWGDIMAMAQMYGARWFTGVSFGVVGLKLYNNEYLYFSDIFTLDTPRQIDSGIENLFFAIGGHIMSIEHNIPECLIDIVSSIDIFITPCTSLLHLSEGANIDSKKYKSSEEATRELLSLGFYKVKSIPLSENGRWLFESGVKKGYILERPDDGAEGAADNLLPIVEGDAKTVVGDLFGYNSRVYVFAGREYMPVHIGRHTNDLLRPDFMTKMYYIEPDGPVKETYEEFAYAGPYGYASDSFRKVGDKYEYIEQLVDATINVIIEDDDGKDKELSWSGKIQYPLSPVFSVPSIRARRMEIYVDLSSVYLVSELNASLPSYNRKEYGIFRHDLYPSLRYGLSAFVNITDRYDYEGSPKPGSSYWTNAREGGICYSQPYQVEMHWDGTMVNHYDYRRDEFGNITKGSDGWTMIDKQSYNAYAGRYNSEMYFRTNQIRYGEPANPFVMKSLNTVEVGKERIMALSTTAKAISQGQFGQFPIYAFCTDGIWALSVNEEGKLFSTQPATRDVCSNANSITQIDGAVVFSTDQGLKMIQGGDSVLLSEAIEGHNVDERLYFKDGFFASFGEKYKEYDSLVVQETRDFRDILKTCEMSYDYANSLLRIFPKRDNADRGIPYRYYAYSFSSQEFISVIGDEFRNVDEKGNVTYSDARAVVLDYPSSIVQIGDKLYRPMETEREGVQNGLLLTRPLLFDEPFALKKLHDLRLQYSNFSGDSKCKVVVYVSNDGVHWKIARSLRGGAYKYFRIAVITKMTDADALTGAIVRYELERTNKLR